MPETETLRPADVRLRHDNGLLGQALARRLAAAPHPHPHPQPPKQPQPPVQLLAADTADAGAALVDALRAEAAGAWLPVVAELDRIVIGPLVRPDARAATAAWPTAAPERARTRPRTRRSARPTASGSPAGSRRC